MIFQRTGTRAGGGGFTVTHNDKPSLSPAQVSVTDTGGTRVAIHPVTVNETITRGSRIYTAAVQFHIQTAGRYQIRVNTDGASEVVVARSLGETLRGFVTLAAFPSGGNGCLGALNSFLNRGNLNRVFGTRLGEMDMVVAAKIAADFDSPNFALLDHFYELPMMIFSSRYQKAVNGLGAPTFTPEVSTLSIDKRTGKRLFDQRVASGIGKRSDADW